MSFFRPSLSEDFVDRYNHTWFFWSLLFLSVVTFLLPLSPTLHPIKPSGRQAEYSAHCWCPSQFTDSQRTYTDTVCGAAFNIALRGEPQNNGVILQTVSDFPLDISRPVNVVNETSYLALGVESNIGLEFFLFVKTPLMLFLFALCLKLPHYIWLQFASSYGGDLNKVLEASIQGPAGQEPENRRRLIQNILSSFSKFNGKRSAALWYLTFKGFACFIVVSILILISLSLLHELGELELLTFVQKTELKTDYTDLVLICGFSIRSLTTVHQYTVQCGFQPVKSSNSLESAADITLDLYKALYTVLMFAFFALAVVNILNLIIWLVKLFRRRGPRGSKMSLDGRLLVNLAHDNIGPLAGQELAETLNSLTTKDEENQVV